MTTEEKSKKVEKFLLEHIEAFGGVYEMRDDLGVVVYQDHDSHDLILFSYDEYLEHIYKVMADV